MKVLLQCTPEQQERKFSMVVNLKAGRAITTSIRVAPWAAGFIAAMIVLAAIALFI